MACFANPDNQPLCESRERNETPEKAAFQTNAHTGEMHTVPRENEPLSQPAQGHDGGMQCSWLAWVAAQDDLPLNLQGFLARLARLADTDGRITMTQAQIAASVKLSERQTRTLLREAVTSTALKRERRGGAGAGRISDVLTLNHERNATDVMLPVARQPEGSATNQPPPLARDATDAILPVAGCSPLPEATANGASLPVDNENPVHIRNASARAEPLTNKTTVQEGTSTVEDNPETKEDEGKGGAGGKDLFGDAPKPKRVQRKKHQKFVATEETLPAALTLEMGTIATERGLRNGTCDIEFAQWRRYHIRECTVMTFPARSWQTWVNNWANRQKSGGQKSVQGKRPIQRPDGSIAYTRRHVPVRSARA